MNEVQALTKRAIPCTQDIDRLAAKWEDIAHTEAQPLFGRESKAGGKIETNISTMKEALSTKATLRPHPSFAAKILHRHSTRLAKKCTEEQWMEVHTALNSKTRAEWYRRHLLQDSVPQDWTNEASACSDITSLRQVYSQLKQIVDDTPAGDRAMPRPHLESTAENLGK